MRGNVYYKWEYKYWNRFLILNFGFVFGYGILIKLYSIILFYKINMDDVFYGIYVFNY